MTDKTFLLLGGAGLVGMQVASKVTTEFNPDRVIIVSLTERETREAVESLQALFPERSTQFIPEWGDVFLRTDFSRRQRRELLSDDEAREMIFRDLLGPVDEAYARSRLAQLIRDYKPDVVVDAINTATAISYQNVYSTAIIAKQHLEEAVERIYGSAPDHGLQAWQEASHDIEALILSQAVPQLVRHVLILDRALRETGARMYLKVGTTGTGGMGMNIPYTHSEDRPSATLMTKTSVGFAHTGLLFLMARTAGGPLVKEVKPAALIGYADVAQRPIRERGEPVHLYQARSDTLNTKLALKIDKSEFRGIGELELPVVDTGENGVFTRGEFEAITANGQMEFVTPEEIADVCILEIRGGNTGREMIAAIDATVMDPTYRAGLVRAHPLEALRQLEEQTGTHSVALGQLGPPELSKLLWETELLKLEYGTLEAVVQADPQAIATQLEKRVEGDERLRNTITSLGLPILSSDGSRLTRGPFIRIPEVPGATEVDISDKDRDEWAAKGWVDLRPANFAAWKERFQRMIRSTETKLRGSAAITKESYPYKTIENGAVVSWVFVNELHGYRIK